MRISSRGEYGLRALIELARRYGEGPVPCADIAEHQRIPENYLSQLLIALRNAGLIESVRGPKGGHSLAKAPADISLREALNALEGPQTPTNGSQENDEIHLLPSERCLHDVWQEVEKATDRILKATTLADICMERVGMGAPR